MTDDLTKIKAALAELVMQMVEIDMRPREQNSVLITATPFDMSGPIPNLRDLAISRVLRDPVRGACRNAIRLLGERIFELTGDIDVMREISEIDEVCPAKYEQRIMSIFNSAWDGIGAEGKGYWVA